MTITIRDVAQRLNLSITTVSRALDGYDDVAEGTRQEVIRTASEMGYSPNRAARQLRRQRADAIGYVLPASTPRFSEPFYEEFVSGLGDEASRHNYDLLVTTAAPGELAERQVYQRWVQGRRVDGLVLNRLRLHDWRAHYLEEMSFPFVGLERPLNLSDAAQCAFVEVDSRAGFRQLMAHLVERGHRRIAYIGAQADLTLQADRLEGYQSGLQKAGISFDPGLVAEGTMTRRGGYGAAQGLLALSQPPTAIVCVNDLTAIGVLHAAHDRGLQIGRDLAVAGFDGIDETEHTQPPLTTLKQPLYQMACTLVEMLLALIAGEEQPERGILLQPELIIRESTGDKPFSGGH